MIKLTGVPGKTMIVCHSRRVCALLYDEIITLRPEWAHPGRTIAVCSRWSIRKPGG